MINLREINVKSPRKVVDREDPRTEGIEQAYERKAVEADAWAAEDSIELAYQYEIELWRDLPKDIWVKLSTEEINLAVLEGISKVKIVKCADKK
jgi:hypothetical protein